MSATSVGVIGLGAMGWPIAHQLREAGREVVVTDASAAARDRAAAAGFSVSETNAALAARVGAVVLSLPNDAIVRQVTRELWATDGGLLVCDTSTIGPGTARELADLGPHLDTPILGRPAGVGSWTIPVGGTESLFGAAREVLEPLARRVVRVGDPGAAAALKVCNNLMLSAINAVTAEALALAGASGLDPATFVDVVLDSGAATVSGLFRDVAPRAVAGDFVPVFSVALMRKDAQLALDLAASVGVDLDVVAASQRLNDAAIEAGLGGEDSIAVLKTLTG
ncbi:NAD(P)-dependent oxidoreductase [Aestuariimicrobium kwangyangense]|uniref:NAD(P)-dependent oxidoreductase n=1 Tax=Aestuariimicrobium kwangyangense TaxID=396389 RepID=UPI0003B55409|nr:NAD(P)-dependent oxidoreductase [Aestuariimicrobium kwangyangense]